MLLFIPRSLCALKRVAAKSEHARFGATQGIRIASASGFNVVAIPTSHGRILKIASFAFPKQSFRACKNGVFFTFSSPYFW